MYPSNGAGAQYTASAGATEVLLPVRVPSVYDLAGGSRHVERLHSKAMSKVVFARHAR